MNYDLSCHLKRTPQHLLSSNNNNNNNNIFSDLKCMYKQRIINSCFTAMAENHWV